MLLGFERESDVLVCEAFATGACERATEGVSSAGTALVLCFESDSELDDDDEDCEKFTASSGFLRLDFDNPNFSNARLAAATSHNPVQGSVYPAKKASMCLLGCNL